VVQVTKATVQRRERARLARLRGAALPVETEAQAKRRRLRAYLASPEGQAKLRELQIGLLKTQALTLGLQATLSAAFGTPEQKAQATAIADRANKLAA
jgi:hypothetical protein